MADQERRRAKRVKGDIAVAINDAESNIISETQDISTSGVCCKTNKALPLMSKVVVTLLLPSESKGKKSINKLKCQGIVVRHEPIKSEPGFFSMAIYFADLSKQDFKAIEKYVDYVDSKV